MKKIRKSMVMLLVFTLMMVAANATLLPATAYAATQGTRRIAYDMQACWQTAKFATGDRTASSYKTGWSFQPSAGYNATGVSASMGFSYYQEGNKIRGIAIPQGQYVNIWDGQYGEYVWAYEIARSLPVGKDWRGGRYQQILCGWGGTYFYIDRSMLGY